MDPARWEEVKRIFADALEIAVIDRPAFVRERSRGDIEIEAEVLSLLDEVRESASDTLERSAAELIPELTREHGGDEFRQIGPYRVLRHVGQGGMGAVYEAEREDEYRKRVAIKLIPSGVRHAEVLRRFQQERQILAGLNHPNIAMLFDGGATADGVPWFAMEYVDGLPVDAYCDAHRLDVRQRLELFREICAAVSFAHGKLVIHRDLKPSNILVTRDGAVKLLDFGIAKLLEEGGESGIGVTRAGYYLVTPEYTSPEQVRSGPTTTAADIYSLGVLLYKLLTGHLPYDVASLPLPAASRIICEEEPKRPSAAVTDEPAEHRIGVPSRRLRRLLAGDLDAIVLMALRKEPELRYASVDAFSADIGGYLEGRPVRARRGSRVYHARKFLVRNRWTATGAAVLLLSLTGGAASTYTQAQRAERRFAEVRALANTFLFEVHDAIADLPGSTPARELLLSTAVEYLDRLSEDARDDPELLAELIRAYTRVGDVQGNSVTNNLGRSEDALHSYRRALALAEQLVERRAGDAGARRLLGIAHARIGDILLETGDLAGAAEHYLADLSLSEDPRVSKPDDIAALRALRFALNNVGLVYARMGRDAEALELDRQALELALHEVEIAPEDPLAQRGLMVAHNRLSDRLLESGDIHTALEGYLAADVFAQAFVARDSLNDQALRDLTVSHYKIGAARYTLGEYPGALERYEAMATINAFRAEADSANVSARRDLAFSWLQVGDTHAALGAADSALVVTERAREIYEGLASEYPAVTDFQRDLAFVHATLAVLLRPTDPAAAAGHHGRAVGLLRELVERDPANAQVRGDLERLLEGDA